MSNIFIAIKLVAANIMASLSKRFGITSQKGATMIEYALIAALISVVALTTLGQIGANVNTQFIAVKNAL
jgi:pilus assembly protein Flp/PilA